MHHSRLACFVIDCQTDDLDRATRFWSAALGRAAKPSDPESPKYRALEVRPEEPILLTQQVSHPSRIHLDIETDDLEAEVRRLTALGAKELQRVQTWVVMEAPTGQRFCVVRPQRGSLEHANRWD